MKYFVYVLRCDTDSRRYVGMTGDLIRRLKEHQEGRIKSTRHRKPLKLVQVEEFSEKSDAEKRERFYKTGRGRELLRELGI